MDPDDIPHPGTLEAGAQPNAMLPAISALPQEQQGKDIPHPQEPQFQPEADPTRISQLGRTPEFLTSAPQDIVESYGHAASQAFDDLTSKTDNWMQFFGRKARGALGAVGLPYAGVTPAIAHLGAAGSHAVGSIISPRQASFDVADTLQHPYQGDESDKQVGWKDVLLPKILGGDLNPSPNKPHGLVSAWRPAAEIGQMTMRPQGATAAGMEKMSPSQFHSGDVFKHGSEQYEYLKQLGGKFDPDRVSSVADEVQSALHDAGYPRSDPTNRPLWRAVDQLRTQTEPTFKTIDTARQAVNAIGEREGMSHPAAIARTGIDDFFRNLTAADMTGNPETAPLFNHALHEARRDWAQGSKLEMLENMRQSAELKSGQMMGGPDAEKTLVANATRLLDPKNAWQLRGWTDQEKQLLERISKGTIPQRTAALIGNLAPDIFSRNPADMMRNLIHGAAGVYGGPLAWAGSLGTMGAKRFAEGALNRNWEALSSEIARTTPAYQAMHLPSVVRKAAPTAQAINLAHQLAQRNQSNQ